MQAPRPLDMQELNQILQVAAPAFAHVRAIHADTPSAVQPEFILLHFSSLYWPD